MGQGIVKVPSKKRSMFMKWNCMVKGLIFQRKKNIPKKSYLRMVLGVVGHGRAFVTVVFSEATNSSP